MFYAFKVEYPRRYVREYVNKVVSGIEGHCLRKVQDL
jgi:hypothetical protein